MSEDTRAGFDAGAEAWADYNKRPLGRIRREVTWRNLAPHLPPVTAAQAPPRVLDAGGGSGELALLLAQRGYRVWLLDYAPAMLAQARSAARSLPDPVRRRLTFCLMSAEEANQAFAPRFFDVIACHTLIEYLPRPVDLLRGLVRLLDDRGLLSLSFVNRHAEVLRQVWARQDPAGARLKLEDGAFCARLFGLSGLAYSLREVSAWLEELGLTVTASCGVRCFADHLPPERLDDPAFFEELLRLEIAAATRTPYLWLARYGHLIAHKNVE